MSYKDRAYCGSPKCKNECGRRLSTVQMIEAFEKDELIEYADFCDEEGNLQNETV